MKRVYYWMFLPGKEAIEMRLLLSILLAVLGMMGCAQAIYQDAQDKMDRLGAVYTEEGVKQTQAMGTRYYKTTKEKAQSAMLLALTNADISIENQDVKSGFINGRSTLPKPLTKSEFDQAWKLEEARAKQITGYDIMWPGTIDLITNVLINERANDVQINVRFRMKHTVVKENWIILTQIPPEVTKIAYKKIWDEFEKTGFVQEKIISGN